MDTTTTKTKQLRPSLHRQTAFETALSPHQEQMQTSNANDAQSTTTTTTTTTAKGIFNVRYYHKGLR
jgi:hypothetical protein